MQAREWKYAAWLGAVVAFSPTAPAAAQVGDADVELEVEAEEPDAGVGDPPLPQVSPQPAPPEAEVAALRETIARLEARLAAVEADAAAEDAAEAEALGEEEEDVASDANARARWWDVLDLRVSGYIQTQLVFSQLSHDELGPDGTPLNQDRFVIRRGRLRIDRTWDYASLAFEVDGSTTRGPFFGVRRAEVSFFLPNLADDRAPPWIMVTAGLTGVPFGFELQQSNRDRWFLERSTGSLAFQRGEPDIGVRLSGGVGPLRYAFAVMNGNPLDDRAGGEPIDLTRAKDVIGRVGIETGRANRFELSGGLSFHVGTGLSPGSPATKPSLIWTDSNEDGRVDFDTEITSTPGQAATPSRTFKRWGANVDLQVGFRTPIGWTRLYGELTMASNLDRSLYVADPIANAANLRELAWYAAVLQEVTEYGIVGFRVDSYNPNGDFLDDRTGVLYPTDASILTLSPMIGAQLPRRGRLVLQYDRIRDHLGRDAAGVPTDLRNDQFVARLQMEF